MASGREGDWECGGCRNRNYAFRSFCNRCKQPRLLVDIKTPADSKWLPRIGDWICIGCSNNNYASREKCKKCGQSKEETAMPAIAMLRASLPTFTHNFPRADGVLGTKMNLGMVESYFHQSQGLNYKNGVQSVAGWPFSGPPKGWRMGDWICNCGFHNYSSRAQCKKCNGPLTPGIPPTVANYAVTDLSLGLGSKRLASEEFAYELDIKRLNAGDTESHFLGGSRSDQVHGMHSKYGIGSSMMPAILGKGAKQWRDGDWMCSHCNNHNFATRSFCNRCKTEKEGAPHPVSVV